MKTQRDWDHDEDTRELFAALMVAIGTADEDDIGVRFLTAEGSGITVWRPEEPARRFELQLVEVS